MTSRMFERKEHESNLLVRVWLEIRQQLRTAFPTLASMLLYKVPWLISLRFVGGIGSNELAAAALAATICNVTGLSLSVGLSSALTTLAAQARGDLLVRRARRADSSQQMGHSKTSMKGEGEPFLSTNGYHAYGPNGACNSPPGDEPNDSGTPILPLVHFYRGVFIQCLFVLPVGLWWIRGIKPVLLVLGQGELVSSMTDDYLRVLTPGLWSYSINWTLTAWLQAVEMADVPAYAAAVGLGMHIPFNFLFIYVLGWGYLGCAAATVMFQLIQPLLMLFYLFSTASGRTRLLHAMASDVIGRKSLSFWAEAREALDMSGIVTYLSLAVPGIVIISEWWASEVSIFLAGRLTPMPDLALGAMTLYQSLNTFCFMFPVACSVAGSTRVGSLLGAGDTAGARFSSRISILCSAMISGMMSCILYYTPHTFFPSLFAPDEPELINETARTISLLAVYVFADGIQSAFNGTVKGCGSQAIIMPVVVVAYWIVGIPLAYYTSLIRYGGVMCTESYFCGVVGLVAGMTVGTWVHMLLLGVLVVGYTDWEIEAKKAQDRLQYRQQFAEDTIRFDEDPAPLQLQTASFEGSLFQ